MADEELSSSGGSEELEDDAETEFHHRHAIEEDEEEFDDNAEDEEEVDEREDLDSGSDGDMGPASSLLASGAIPSSDADNGQARRAVEDIRSAAEQMDGEQSGGGRQHRGDGSQTSNCTKGDGGLLDDMAVAQQYSVVQLHPTDGRILTLRSALEPRSKQRVPLIPTPAETAREKDHCVWLEQLSAAASRHSQVEGSRFSLLLHARLVIIASEIRAARLRPQQGLHPIKDQEKAARGSELPRLVVIGLGTFFQALKSLCAERHALMEEVAGSLCTMLEGLPRLSFAEREEGLLDSLQDLLGSFVTGDGSRGEREVSLKAYMMLAMLRGSVKGVLESALLATRQPELSMPVHQHLAMIAPDPPARQTHFPLTDKAVLLRQWPCASAPPRSEAAYITMATDGVYLYLHSQAGLVKMACGKPVPQGERGAAAEEAGQVVKAAPYRQGERGWLVCAGGKLYFRVHRAGGGGGAIQRVSCETLEEEGELVLGEEAGAGGPLMSDGRLLYLLGKGEHCVVRVVDPEGEREPLRCVRLAGPACGGREGGGRGEGEVLDCDVLACGQNRKGELGHAASKEELLPTLISGTCKQRVLKIAAGNETSYFLSEEGKVLCCGLNGSGQLGRATRGGEHRAEIEAMDGLPRGRIVEICCFNGAEHVILLTDEGRLYSCGCNAYGQLGIDHVRRSSLLVLVEPLLHVKIAAVACSYHHSIAVTEQGEAYSFGLNDHGQLGIGSSRHSSGPKVMVLPRGTKLAAASCGQHHSVLLTADGKVLSCGRNHTGQLGLGTRGSADTPQPLEGFGGDKVVLVACGYTHTLALTKAGRVYSFGNNNQGQLGHGNVENVMVPKLVEALAELKCVKVSCGAHHSCVLTDTSRVYAFGSNCHGQLGQGDTVERASPVVVPGLDGKGIIDIACGFHHLIALTADTSEAALDDAALLPSPEGAIFQTDGTLLSVYQPPALKGGAPELGAVRGCRSFSMETGMHASDLPSTLTGGHGALAFDPASNAYWALARGATLELYANIGGHVPPHLRECCAESKFPCVSEAFLALPEHMVSEQCSVHDASTGALVTLACIDVMSRHTPEEPSPSRWRPWTVDARPQTLQVMSAVLAHCQQSVDNAKLQHLAVFCLRLVRVNMAELVRLGATEEGPAILEACAGAAEELLGRVQALLSTGSLASTPVHYECCRVMIDGLLVFFPSGSRRVDLLLSLLSKLADDGVGKGELLLARLLLEAVAESREVAMSLIPTAGEEAEAGVLAGHCDAFRQLLLLLVVMLDQEAGVPGAAPQLVSEVAMMLLRGLVGEAVEDPSGVTFGACLHPLLQHMLSKAAAAPRRASASASPPAAGGQAGRSYFFSSLLPWAVTCSFMFVSDLAFARAMMPIAVDLAEGVAALGAAEEDADGDSAGEVLVESMHPYEPSEREVYHVSLPGAAFLTVEFDSSCDLAEGDSVQLYADSLCRQPVSAPLSGPALSGPLPAPILVVMGESCCVSFESGPATTTGRWGFRCSVKGHASPVGKPWWATLVRRAALVLAGHCAAAIFQGDAPPPRAQTEEEEEEEAQVAQQDPVALQGGLTGEAVAALEELEEGAEPLGALEKLLGVTRPLLHALICAEGEGGAASELLRELRAEGGAADSGLAGGVGVRQELVWQARRVALAAILAELGLGSLDSARLRELWGLAGGVELAVMHAQQVLKVEMLQAAEGRGSVGGEEEEAMSRRALEEVLAELRAKAILFACAARERQPLPPPQAAERALGYLKSGSRARESVEDLRRRRGMVVGRVAALEGMLRVLQSPGADDGVKSDVVKLLSAHMERSSMARPSMCEPAPHRALCAAYCAIVSTCAQLLPASPAASSLRKAFLSLLPSLPLEQAEAELRGVIDSVWDMCTAQPAPASPRHPPLAPGQLYGLPRQGALETTPKLSGKYWVAAKVLEVLEGGQARVEVAEASGAAAETMEVAVESLEGPVEAVAAGGLAVGERVLVPLAEVAQPTAAGSEKEAESGVWVGGTVLGAEEQQAEVALQGASLEGAAAERVKLPAGKLRCLRRAASGPSVTVSRDLCGRAEVSSSSSGSMVDKVLDGRLETYWQSSGSRPHWIDFVLPQPARLQGVLMYINYAKDRSFTPKRVTVKVGPSVEAKDLRQLCEFQIRQGADGWTNVLQPSAAGQVGQCVRITICDNQDSGCNSRVRSVKLVASWAHGEADDTLAGRGSRLMADAGQASLRLLAASLVLNGAGETGGLQALERRSLECVWACLDRCIRSQPLHPTSRATAEWVDFLVAASRTRALREYLEEPAKHECLLEMLQKGSRELQTKLLHLYAVVLPALVRYPQAAILDPILEIAGRALSLSNAGGKGRDVVHWSIGVQCVYLLRTLQAAPSWEQSVEAVLREALVAATGGEAAARGRLKLVAALAVLGGLIDGLRVGAKVARVGEEESEVAVGEVVTMESDCAMLGVKTAAGGEEVVQSVHVATVRVTDAVKHRPSAALLPALLVVFRAVHSKEAGEALGQEGSGGEALGLVQVQCMAARAVRAQAEEGAEGCLRGGMLRELLAAAGKGAGVQEPAGVRAEHVYCGVLERMSQPGGWGGEAGGGEREGGGEVEPASPGEASRQEEARAREAQREAMAMDLMALGYGQRLCMVALQLNGDDPQAAATWLLDSSAQYLENHPELLQQPEQAAASLDRAGEGEAAGAEDTVVEQSYFAPRGDSGVGEAVDRQAGNVLRVEEVKAGMLVQVVASGAVNRGMEGMFGRCGVVAAVDRETQTASVRWGPRAVKGRAMSAVAVGALGRPDPVSARTLCYPLGLQGEEAMEGAARGLLGRLHGEAVAEALAKTVERVAEAGAAGAWPSAEAGAQTSKAEGGQGPTEAEMSRLLQVVAEAAERLPEDGRGELHAGLAGLVEGWLRAGKGGDETDANIDAAARVGKQVVEECVEQLAGAAVAEWVVTEESAHPLAGPPESSAKAVVGAWGWEGAVSVMFDARCHLASGQRLQVFADERCRELAATCAGKGPAAWAPLVLPSNSLRVRLTGPAGQGGESVWGYRLAVTPLTVPAVQLTGWAVRSFLDCAAMAPAQLAALVTHITDVVQQLGLPCPLRVSLVRALVGLIRRAASGVVCAKEAEVQAALGRALALAAGEVRARYDREAGQQQQGQAGGAPQGQLSSMLQAMAELLSACAVMLPDALPPRAAGDEEGMEGAGEAEEVEGAGELRQLVEDMELERREVRLQLAGSGALGAEEAVVLGSLMAEALEQSGPLGPRCDALLCEALLAEHAPFELRESKAHPYPRGTEEKGSVVFPGAVRLRVVMDRRSASDGDDYLTLYASEDESAKVASYSGTFGTAAGGGDARIAVEGDRLSYSFVGKKASHWGYRFIVRPEYGAAGQVERLRRNRAALEDAVAGMVLCEPAVDAALVQLVNRRCEDGGLSALASPVRLALPGKGEEGELPEALSRLPAALLRFRLAVLQAFNALLVTQILPVLDFSLASLRGTILHTLRSRRELLFLDVKTSFMQASLSVHVSQGDKPVVVVDRRSQKTVFEQLLGQIGRMAASRLWHPDMAFLVQFLGEGAEGYNGPYRECFSTTCAELESRALPLLAPSPNREVGGTAPHQDCFVLRPASRAPCQLDMLRFLGRLFGIAVWTRLPLDLHLPPAFWRRLVSQAPREGDLAEIDVFAHRLLREMQRPAPDPAAAEGFPETFELLLSDGTSMQLCDGGAARAVTADSRLEYAARARAARLQESAPQLRAIRRGLEEMLPFGLVELLDGRELERLVTGSAAVDVQLLREHTVCRGEEGHEDVVEALWEVLGSLPQESLAAFLRFVWGRSRLPRPSEFTETFKIHVSPPADNRLPKADTCFFTLNLPAYSTPEILRARLIYAIHHCKDMDADLLEAAIIPQASR